MSRKWKGKVASARQFAALPFKEEGDERLVMLVTSRETKRWVLPKGWPEKGLKGPELAAKEAFEEAGIVGQPLRRPVGSYSYSKILPKGRTIECEVKVFPLRVMRLLNKWPEHKQRTRQWFTFAQAAMAVEEAELVTLLIQLGTP